MANSNVKIRIGVKSNNALFPNVGIITPTVPSNVAGILILGFDRLRKELKDAGSDWANKLVCEYRN